MKSKGKVFLVGAGPGDPGLITAKGAQLLKECDAVVYDRLVPLELVVTLPLRVERHYVGKSPGRHWLPQKEINAMLAQLAQKGLKVVRLKGGDPFVFGCGGVEALYLKKKGVPFEIVPGVTAGIGGPAYAGIPVTHRGKSVFTILLTVHEAQDKDEPQVPWDWLGRAHNGSIVGYMAVKQLPQAVRKLIKAGMQPDIPAALVQQGTTGVQKTVSGTLQELPALSQKEKIQPPALFIIGETVELAEGIKWFGDRILSGKNVMVTRPADQAGEIYALMRSHGAEILPLPTIFTAENVDRNRWDELKTIFDKNSKNQDNKFHKWLVFTSENGVRYFIRQLQDHGFDYRAIAGFRIAAVGSGTGKALSSRGLHADFIPSRATTAALAKELSSQIAGQGSLIIRVRGNLGNDHVERALESAGAEVMSLQVYSTSTAKWDTGMWAQFEESPPDIITFSSGSTVTGFIKILGADRAREIAAKAAVASIGPMTTEIAQEEGIQVIIEAEDHSVPGLVEAIVKHFQKG